MNRYSLNMKIRREGITEENILLYSNEYQIFHNEISLIINEHIFNKNPKIIKYFREMENYEFSFKQYLIYKSFKETNKKDSKSKEFHISKYGEKYYKEFFEKAIESCKVTKEKYIEKYGAENGPKKWEDYCNSKGHNIENYKKWYGEEYLEKYNNWCKSNKGNLTLERQIEIYGEEGKKRFDEINFKMKNKNNLDYYILKFGEKEGTKKYYQRNLKNSESSKLFAQTVDSDFYDHCSETSFIQRYGEEEGKKRYEKFKEKQKENSLEMWKREEYRENHKIAMKLAQPKIRKTMEEKIMWIPLEKKKEWELYCMEVSKITTSQKLDTLKHFEKWGNRRLDENAFELDHKISKKYGFDNNIPPEIIGDIDNLQFIHWKDNSTKGTNCYSFINY